ncbi:MAG: hypothetical protein MUQ00_04135 [Candidatus Aminicenantes bacterium]|nr:hypothetical protein [Candidatus Aminicenantes bacterium]
MKGRAFALTSWVAAGALLLAVPARPAEKRSFVIQGETLVYSYDHNQIYGEKVAFEVLGYKVTAAYFKADIPSRQALAYGSVTLAKDAEKLEADELVLSLEGMIGTLVRYGPTIETSSLGAGAAGTEGRIEGGPTAAPGGVFDGINLDKIKKSFLSFSARTISLTDSFEVLGTGVTMYLEGLESMGFKRFRLSDGVGPRRNGFAINRIWYNKTQGLIGRASYSIEKPNKVASLTQLNYEERSFLKNNYGIERQVDLLTSTTLTLDETLRMGFTGNYNSSSQWNVQTWVGKTWSPAFTTQFDFSYNKPVSFRGEAWLGFQSQLSAGKWGNLAVQGRYELRNQAVAGLNYGASFLNHFSLNLQSYYSRVKIGDSRDFSEIFTGGLNLSYSSRLFNLGTDYFLNYDLFGGQVLSQPQLRIGLNPIVFYGGLLSVSLNNIALYSQIGREGLAERSFSDNAILSLAIQPVELFKDLRLNLNLALEQFVEREGRNFTTGGIVFNAVRKIGEGISVEAYYSLSSRRRTRSWLIEGTTGQDLSLVARAMVGETVNSWVSVSYDAKNAQLRQSFADFSFKVVRNWSLHAILNYDFFLKKLNNIDLYIVREAGRLQFRLIWRSLSRQFLVEFVPR